MEPLPYGRQDGVFGSRVTTRKRSFCHSDVGVCCSREGAPSSATPQGPLRPVTGSESLVLQDRSVPAQHRF
jgi:hypothetical protein